MSKSGSWYAGFDVVDIETTPWDEVPEDDGFHLVCPVEGCEHEAEFEHLGEIRDSEWSGLSNKDHILTDGTTLKQAYCPAHALDEEDNPESLPPLRQGLGVPCDSDNRFETSTKSDYSSMYQFTEGPVEYSGVLIHCGCDTCHRKSEFSTAVQAEEEDWVSGKYIGLLANGQNLHEGRCPEHR